MCMYFGVIYININIYTMHTRFPQPDIYWSKVATLFSTSLEEFAGEKPDRQPEEVKHFTKLSAF